MANRPVNFANPDDFKRMAKAVRAAEGMPRIVGQPGPTVPVGSSHSMSHFRCTGAYNADAKGWPGVLTYRNFESVSEPADWIDGEEVYAEEINGGDLESGRRYRCHVYGLKTWEEDVEGTVDSMFVLIDKTVDTDGGIWVEITGGSAALGYSGKRVERTAGLTWADSTGPLPLTWTNKIFRSPIVAGSAPEIPVGHVVRGYPSVNESIALDTSEAGRQTVTHVVVTDVTATCVAGSIVLTKTTKTLTITGRDLTSSLV